MFGRLLECKALSRTALNQSVLFDDKGGLGHLCRVWVLLFSC